MCRQIVNRFHYCMVLVDWTLYFYQSINQSIDRWINQSPRLRSQLGSPLLLHALRIHSVVYARGAQLAHVHCTSWARSGVVIKRLTVLHSYSSLNRTSFLVFPRLEESTKQLSANVNYSLRVVLCANVLVELSMLIRSLTPPLPVLCDCVLFTNPCEGHHCWFQEKLSSEFRTQEI